MKNDSPSDPHLPESAQRTFEAYPHLAASPDFNRRVLESLQGVQAAHDLTLMGRIEAFLGLSPWQFLGTGAVGALFSGLFLAALLLLSRTTSAAMPTPVSPSDPVNIPAGPMYARRLLENNFLALDPSIGPSIGVPAKAQVAPPLPVKNHPGGEVSCVDSKSRLV